MYVYTRYMLYCIVLDWARKGGTSWEVSFTCVDFYPSLLKLESFTRFKGYLGSNV